LVNDTILCEIFEKPRTANILYGNLYEVLPNSNKKLQISLSSENLTLANFNSNTHATIQHPAAFIHKSLFDKGLYDESYKIIADIKFFIDKIIFQNCTVEYIPIAITNFDLSGLSSQSSNWAKTIDERSQIFKDLLPPRILKDYEVFLQIKDSPLLKFIPFLQKTDRLNKMVTQVVGTIIKFYSLFRKLH